MPSNDAQGLPRWQENNFSTGNETLPNTINKESSKSIGSPDLWKIARIVVNGATVIAPLVLASGAGSRFVAPMQTLMSRIAPEGVRAMLQKTGTEDCSPDMGIVDDGDFERAEEGLFSNFDSKNDLEPSDLPADASTPLSFSRHAKYSRGEHSVIMEVRVRYQRNIRT